MKKMSTGNQAAAFVRKAKPGGEMWMGGLMLEIRWHSRGGQGGVTASKPQHGAAGKTGSWRTFKPDVDKATCKKCGNCILYCPDSCIDRDLNVDYDYCKGCGICANECPSKSIKMVRE
jgi:pyruvate ferredoxin oxidoreductase delta subunit